MMRSAPWIVAVLLVFACTARASAQALLPPAPLATPSALPSHSAPRAPAQQEDSEADEVPFGDPAPGLAGRLAVTGALELLWYLDSAHEAFAREQGVTAGGLSASLTLLELAPHLLLDVGLGWRNELSEGPLLQSLTASYESNTEYVDGALRFELTPWLVPRARVSVGAQYLSASLAPNDGSTPLEGAAFSLVTTVGAGIELLGRVGDGLTSRDDATAAVALSLVVEGGIVLGTNTELTVKPREPRNAEAAADRIPVVGTKLGSLGGIAPYLRISGVLRF
jgi:hypothetical protein